MSRANLRNKRRKRPDIVLLLLLIFFCSTCGWMMGKISTAITISQVDSELISNVDVVPQSHQLGLSLYLENCVTCHVAVPPQVLPTESWRIIIQDSQHYGVQLPPLVDPPRQLIWNYLQVSSRRKSPKEERIPYRIFRSRYFQALHPEVKLPQKLNIKGCVSCHPQVEDFDFRTLNNEVKSQNPKVKS
ncbi:diheme cytochrome c [Okeania sp.]|uniref:diheme cytochrome c n=1 Tax=Okeania sp. TaxID=3100323 RepID=UPI002B4B209D|nr:diheme cytochrome c [Okeania sp.]MEB3342060.1 diheme cytochrome c [Okeania sp.]